MAEGADGMNGAGSDSDVQAMKLDVQDAGEELAKTIAAIRRRVSYESIKARARNGIRENVIERPEEVVRIAGARAVRAYHRAAESVEQRPATRLIIPGLILGIAAFLFIRLKRR